MKRSFLVVDDYESVRLSAKVIIERSGLIDVDVARSGAEAIEMCRSVHYDAILMDVCMPDMDGVTTAKHIQRIQPKALIFGWSVDPDIAKRMDNVFITTLHKDLRHESVTAICELIDRMLRYG